MGWHLNIIAIEQPYSKVVEYLDVLSVFQQNASFEVATSNINPQTPAFTYLHGFILIFDVYCKMFNDRAFHDLIFRGDEIKMFQILPTPGYKHRANKKNIVRLTGIKEFTDELTLRNILIEDQGDGERLAWQLFNDEIFAKQSIGINDDLWNAKFDLWQVD